MKLLEIGNWMMVVCAGFYLAWWRITFRPPAPEGTPLGNTCIILAFVSGVLGIVLAVVGMNNVSEEPVRSGLPGLGIVAAGAASYVLLLVVSSMALHRQVTSELLIIIGWTVLEFCALNHWFQYGRLPQGIAVLMAVIVLLTAIASLVCYMFYYNVSYELGYLIGSIPLVMTGIVMTIINLSVVFARVSAK